MDSGAEQYRYLQVYEHLTHHPGVAFTEATPLPVELRSTLEKLGASVLRETARCSSQDGTTKLLLTGADGACIETVIMRYSQRVTACVSTQVGCHVGCAFCATGALGFRRNLTAAEIVDQVRTVIAVLRSEDRTLSNVVYMGMGEPLLNLQAVLTSIRLLTDPLGIGMGHRSLSVSTVGIPAGIRRLAEEEPQVNLAISLNAADDRLRALLIPAKYCHPLAEVLNAAWDHFAMTRRKLLVEYVLLGGVNDSPEDARRLAALLKGHVVAVNLLAWNRVTSSPDESLSAAEGLSAAESRPSPEGRRSETPARTPTQNHSPVGFRPATREAIEGFRSILVNHHIETVVRQSKGSGIDAACGQLAARRRSYPAETPPAD